MMLLVSAQFSSNPHPPAYLIAFLGAATGILNDSQFTENMSDIQIMFNPASPENPVDISSAQPKYSQFNSGNHFTKSRIIIQNAINIQWNSFDDNHSVVISNLVTFK